MNASEYAEGGKENTNVAKSSSKIKRGERMASEIE
jgi:hypothetical protein